MKLNTVACRFKSFNNFFKLSAFGVDFDSVKPKYQNSGVGRIFSGFVKVDDPMGMAHKLHAYATAVGLSLTDDSVLLQFGAVSLGVVEFILGIYLLIGVHRRLTTIVTALFMLIFTAITVWIYIDNPVADCGCFGDAITLTNGQTLAKNIVLLSAAVYLSCYPQKIRRFISARNNWVISIYSWIYAIALSLYTLHYLPIIDFSPYTKGANIKAASNLYSPFCSLCHLRLLLMMGVATA